MNTPPTESKLPVYPTACGGTITDTTAYPSALYQGQLIFFCTAACLRAFESDREGFMAGKVEHPMDEE